MQTGKSIKRVDGYLKATGNAKFCDDICDASAYIVKLLHAEIPHGFVRSIDTTAAEKVPGVIKIVTCFDVPDYKFPTAGHPWSTEIDHQDICDRILLAKHVRFYGEDIAAVIANEDIAASKAIRLMHVEYEELPHVYDVQESMKDGSPQLHDNFPKNILKHTQLKIGDYENAIKDPKLIKVDKWYNTQAVQHCHLENHICFAYMENNRIIVTSSTQIPHIARRVVSQALNMPIGKIRIIKPYIGGGFGNKQEIHYEPLCAFLTKQVGGKIVKIDCAREETFVTNRIRHPIRSHIVSWLKPDGTFAARKLECFSNQGAYSSHGHAIVSKGLGAFAQLYKCENVEGDAYTIYTNLPVGGAMRGYGIPQAMFALESHIDDCANVMNMDPLEFRKKNMMPKGYTDNFSKNVNYYDTFNQCLDKGAEYINYKDKRKEYKEQNGPIRRGIGCSIFWYNTGVWPIALESSSCRMILNQDGSLQVQTGETEIGQGCDTVFAQMAADAVGVTVDNVNVISTQDTDSSPFGTGAYASRQTYIGGFSIKQTGQLLKERILEYAEELTRQDHLSLDLVDGNIIRKNDKKILLSLEELALTALYSRTHSKHLTAESTYQIKNNAYSFGCCFAEVEIDIPLCKVNILNIVNVHDCGNLINPALAEAQVHGGMSMGIGFALFEKLHYNEKGRTLNNNLLDYKLASFMDTPRLKAIFIENPEPSSPFKTKALGEPPVCPVAPAIRNAVYNALNIEIDSLPITPHSLFVKLKEKGLI